MSKNKLFLKILFLIIYRSSICNNSISALDSQFHLKKMFNIIRYLIGNGVLLGLPWELGLLMLYIVSL